VSFPALEPEDLMSAMIVDAASHQQEITLDDLDDQLVWQDDRAWPNTFRAIRYMPAFDYVHAQRLRTLVVREVAGLLEPLDAFLCPTFARAIVAATNLSGHPALVVPIGLSAEGLPQAISLCGRWFGEARLVAAGRIVEQAFEYTRRRPPVAW
jgi:Asp-tRNA(Asn)/Glu-tRNA(Gln) amidotransferase A subunit family amidase